MCEDVDSGEDRGWPWSSIGKGKREGGLSHDVLEEGMTVSTVVAVCRIAVCLSHKVFDLNHSADRVYTIGTEGSHHM